MADYIFRGVTNAPAYDPNPGVAIIRQLVDIPALIADPSQLALLATPNDKLTAFPGFRQGDTLNIPLPAMVLEDMGLYCSTREEGSSGDVDISMTACFFLVLDITKGGSGVAGQTAYNPLDESDDPNFPIVNLMEVAFDPAGPTLIQPRHTYYGSNLVVAFDGALTMETAVFQVYAKGTVTFA